MKNSLHVISFLLAAAIPGTCFAEFVGLHLPTALDPEHMISAFVIVVTLLTAFADYSHSAKPLALDTPCPTGRVAQFPTNRVPERLAA